LPRALLDAGFAEAGEILVLEPRRIATRMAARRVAWELGEEVGGRIGYQVRFEHAASARTRVRFVTEGILTRRLVADPGLRSVATVVLDEFHERHLHADLGLALLRKLQTTSRPELRIVVMSATLASAPLAKFLDAPVVEVSSTRSAPRTCISISAWRPRCDACCAMACPAMCWCSCRVLLKSAAPKKLVKRWHARPASRSRSCMAICRPRIKTVRSSAPRGAS
jgi:hypothetical protein